MRVREFHIHTLESSSSTLDTSHSNSNAVRWCRFRLLISTALLISFEFSLQHYSSISLPFSLSYVIITMVVMADPGRLLVSAPIQRMTSSEVIYTLTDERTLLLPSELLVTTLHL